MRTIKIKLLTQNQLHVVKTNATTFGELKKEMSKLDIDWKDIQLIDRNTKASYVLDDSVLPVGDCFFFVMPTKSKHGCYASMGYKELKQTIKQLREEGMHIPFNYTTATTSELRNFLMGLTKKEKLETRDNVITLKPGRYIVVVEESEVGKEYIHVSRLVDATTLEDIEEEAISLKESL